MNFTERRIDGNLSLKTADFGLSRDINESDYYRSGDKKAKIPIRWMAPESLAKSIYDVKTDVVCIMMYQVYDWSLKVILHQFAKNIY